MNSPFKGRALGARAAGPQFPQRRAFPGSRKFAVGGFNDDAIDDSFGLERALPKPSSVPPPQAPPTPSPLPSGSGGGGGGGGGGDGLGSIIGLAMKALPFLLKEGGRVPRKPPGFFLGGLFDSSPATSTTSSKSTTDFSVTDPDYNALKQSVLQRGLSLSQQPYQQYQGVGVVPLTADQTQSFANVRANQGNYQPYFNQAAQSVNQIQGLDPAKAGLPYVSSAAGMQTGTQAATPFVSQAGQTLPNSIGAYMSPYTQSVVKGIQDASNRNFDQNTMKTINDTFSGGNAAQFGRETHGNAVANAVYAKTQADDAAVANALESGYQTAGNQFNSDANRAATLANTTGTLAQTDKSQQAGLGTTAANITNQGITGGAAASQAATGLGQATQTAGNTDANTLSASGAQQQTQAQNEETWKYNQFQNKTQDPYNKVSWAQGVSQGWTLPTQTNTTGTTTSTQTPASGSPFGQILGAATGLLGAAGGIPGLNSLGSLFGGGGVSAAAAPSGGYGGYSGYANTLPGFPGYTGSYAQGGMIPSIAQMRKATMPQQPKGAMPTGMPGMPPMPTLAPQLPGGQPNGQPASPFARGGSVEGHSDEMEDLRMIIKAIHEHERALHEGEPLTKIKMAMGGWLGGW